MVRPLRRLWRLNAGAYLLDIMLPGEDGLEILKKLKCSSKTKSIPVIMVTAKGSEYDKVMSGFGSGRLCDKTVWMMELVSRIKAVLRRSKGSQERENPEIQGVHIDVKKHEVTVDGRTVPLTLKELNCLKS